jgi:ketosteroid isomerase-like protein
MRWLSDPGGAIVSEEAMEVVLDHLHARRRRDIEAVAATLAPDVVHEGVRPELICRNRDEVLSMVERSMQATRFGIERIEILDAGPDQAVLGAAGPGLRDVEEASPDGEVFILMTVRDGRIIRMRDFRARTDALAAARPPLAAG